MKFMVIGITPPQRTLLGTTHEKVEFSEMEGESLEWLKERVQVPLYGTLHIIPLDQVTTLKTRVIQEVVSS